MGMPSIGIYSYELFNFYGVENIIRVGSAGAIAEGLKVRDLVIASGACTNSSFIKQYNLPGTFAPIASFELLKKAVDKVNEIGAVYMVGNVFSSDTFYDDSSSLAAWRKMGVLAVEMESAALYATAARSGKNALCICTVSDCPLSGESLCAEDREKTFNAMIELALEIA